MKITLTNAEYRLLVELVYLGDWMVSAHDEMEDGASGGKYDSLVQKILSYADEPELAGLVERLPDDGKLHPTREVEDGVMDIIYEYDETSFWMELVERLVERDVRATQPDGHLPAIKEYVELAGPLEERYSREFESHGVERLKLPPDA
jgi:hypothetical protein